MAENWNENPFNNKQDDVMSEFRKLRWETTGIHSVFSEKSSIEVANLTGNKLLKNINDACELMIEKQANQEKFNQELRVAIDTVEKKQSEELLQTRKEIENKQEKVSQEILKELRLIRKELEETKQKQNVISMEKDTTQSTPSLMPAQQESDNSEFPNIEKKFVLRHVFKNIQSMEEGVEYSSEEEEHFGIPWRMYISRNDKNLSLYLNCVKCLETGKWKVKTESAQKLVSANGKHYVREGTDVFGNIDEKNMVNASGWPDLIEWEELENFTVDGELNVESHVTIEKIIGIYKKKLRNFDETIKKSSDVVLIVEEKKFHVFKLFLIAQSTYFKSLLMKNTDSEVPITGVDPDDFQIFLEVLYADPAIDESSVEILLLLAEKFDAQTVIPQCEEFLIEKSEKKLKKKLQLALKYNLEELKKDCFEKITSIADIRSVITMELNDPSIMADLLKKTLSLLE